ncbi:MAG: PT domain-containing protein [Rickettsiales bacterium]|nr:PT domain-containing protein [Rickettsiales bacterium]
MPKSNNRRNNRKTDVEKSELRVTETGGDDYVARVYDPSQSSADNFLTERFMSFLVNHSEFVFATDAKKQKELETAIDLGLFDVERDSLDLNESASVKGPKFAHIKKTWEKMHPINQSEAIGEYIEYLALARPELGEEALGFDKKDNGKFDFPKHFAQFLETRVAQDWKNSKREKDIDQYWSSKGPEGRNALISQYEEFANKTEPKDKILSEEELHQWRQDKFKNLREKYDPRSAEGIEEVKYEELYTKLEQEKSKASGILSTAADLASSVVSAVSALVPFSLFSFAAADTGVPTAQPTGGPSASPNSSPTAVPSLFPTRNPSITPTRFPTIVPSVRPSRSPTDSPSLNPSQDPTFLPSNSTTIEPSARPTLSPSGIPTLRPSVSPSETTTGAPTVFRQSHRPTFSPTAEPSLRPTSRPTKKPTVSPTTGQPTGFPTFKDNNPNFGLPTGNPTGLPTGNPTGLPTGNPTGQPTGFPTGNPTGLPKAGQESQDNNGLSSAEKGGIIAGGAVFVGLSAFLATYCLKKCRGNGNERRNGATKVSTKEVDNYL